MNQPHLHRSLRTLRTPAGGPLSSAAPAPPRGAARTSRRVPRRRRAAIAPLVLGVSAAMLMVACGDFRLEEGSGVKAIEAREVEAFSGVEVHGGLDVTLLPGSEQGVVLSGDDNLLPLIKTAVEDDTLVVEPLEDNLILLPNVRLVIGVTTPSLTSAIASGGSSIDGSLAEGGDEAVLRLKGTGGASFDLDGVDVGAAFIELSGGSSARLLGHASVADVDLSGGSLVEMWGFDVLVANVLMSGGSQANMAISVEVNGELSGGSELDIVGAPAVAVDTSGGSDVDLQDRAPPEETDEAPDDEDAV